MNPRRIFILGAGFSCPANLPLGADLFKEIRKEVAFLSDSVQHVFQKDWERYVKYKKLCEGDSPLPEAVNFEEFLSFLDIEHYLSLGGDEEWSPEGNQGQMLIKGLIGKIIQDRTPGPSAIPELYLEFADRLLPGDFILTFNYDILLERTLESMNKPYRLFPQRYDDPGNEIILLKLHGSVNWFDRRTHELDEKYSPNNSPGLLANRVFMHPQRYGTEPIVDIDLPVDNPLKSIYRIRQADEFYSDLYREPFTAPWILSPSYSKILYAATLRELWYGLNYVGGMHVGFGIIGFSLPEHDEYLRQVVYAMVRLYQEAWWNDEIIPGIKKDKVKLIDYRQAQEEVEKFRKRYRFIDHERAEEYFRGFDREALDFLFTRR